MIMCCETKPHLLGFTEVKPTACIMYAWIDLIRNVYVSTNVIEFLYV